MTDCLARTKSFVLAEDDEDFLMIMRLALEAAGFAGKLDLVNNYRALIGYLQEREEPNLIILDLKTAPDDWRTALRGLKGHERYKSIPVAVLTASSEQEDIDLCRRYRGCSLIQKPSNFSAWRICMKNLIRTGLPRNG
jgi:CheY-like chemotaxis protein